MLTIYFYRMLFNILPYLNISYLKTTLWLSELTFRLLILNPIMSIDQQGSERKKATITLIFKHIFILHKHRMNIIYIEYYTGYHQMQEHILNVCIFIVIQNYNIDRPLYLITLETNKAFKIV